MLSGSSGTSTLELWGESADFNVMKVPGGEFCRLCHKHERLVRSHVIPRFSFKQLKKADGHFFELSNNPNKREKKLQAEIREPLFCKHCDTVVLQENEDHLARVFYGRKRPDLSGEGRITVVRGLDYRKAKNGLLSILWRMSLSSHPYFQEVDLGERHSERIRIIISNAEVIGEEEYGVQVCVPLFEGKPLGDLIVPPDYTRVGHNRVYRCVISGFLFTFHVGSAELEPKMRQLVLKADGSCPVIKADVMEIPFLKHFCLEMAAAQFKRENR